MNNDAPEEQLRLSRRGMVKTAAGVATVGAVAIASARTPAEAAAAPAARVPEQDAPLAAEPADLAEPIVVHVRDLKTGELGFFVGTREVTVHDRALAARLAAAANR
jgi:nitrous oxide reductase